MGHIALDLRNLGRAEPLTGGWSWLEESLASRGDCVALGNQAPLCRLLICRMRTSGLLLLSAALSAELEAVRSGQHGVLGPFSPYALARRSLSSFFYFLNYVFLFLSAVLFITKPRLLPAILFLSDLVAKHVHQSLSYPFKFSVY